MAARQKIVAHYRDQFRQVVGRMKLDQPAIPDQYTWECLRSEVAELINGIPASCQSVAKYWRSVSYQVGGYASPLMDSLKLEGNWAAASMEFGRFMDNYLAHLAERGLELFLFRAADDGLPVDMETRKLILRELVKLGERGCRLEEILRIQQSQRG